MKTKMIAMSFLSHMKSLLNTTGCINRSYINWLRTILRTRMFMQMAEKALRILISASPLCANSVSSPHIFPFFVALWIPFEIFDVFKYVLVTITLGDQVKISLSADIMMRALSDKCVWCMMVLSICQQYQYFSSVLQCAFIPLMHIETIEP